MNVAQFEFHSGRCDAPFTCAICLLAKALSQVEQAEAALRKAGDAKDADPRVKQMAGLAQLRRRELAQITDDVFAHWLDQFRAKIKTEQPAHAFPAGRWS